MDQSTNETAPQRKISLRRVSISDTNLPKFDLPQISKDKSPFARYFGGLLEGESNTSLNKIGSSDSIDQQGRNLHGNLTDFLKANNNNTTGQIATPVLHKSATEGYSLVEQHPQQQNNSVTGTFQAGSATTSFHATPRSTAAIEESAGITMNFAAQPNSISSGLGVEPDKKSTFFGGLASFLSFDNMLNKPLQDLKDRESNYRLIMSLER